MGNAQDTLPAIKLRNLDWGGSCFVQDEQAAQTLWPILNKAGSDKEQ